MRYHCRSVSSITSQFLGIAALLLISFAGDQTRILAEETAKLPAAPAATKVLSPDKFVGKVCLGYKAAQAIPDICGKLFCYCGCDLTDSHTSLLDCFTCTHGMDCDICLDEAIVALHLKEQGKSLAEIQKTIDEGFSSQYPWEKPSTALVRYRQTYNINPNGLGTKFSVISEKSTKKTGSGKCCEHK
jgi:hypothetical protein